MEKAIIAFNKVVRYFGGKYVLCDFNMIAEAIAMIAAYRTVAIQHLEPGQVIIWDPDTKAVEIITRH